MNRKWERTKEYADAVKEVASSFCNEFETNGKGAKVPVVDVWDVIWKAAGEQQEALTMFLEDGLHLTKEGYEVSIVLWDGWGVRTLEPWTDILELFDIMDGKACLQRND
jgi:hypothetical protein